MHVAAFLQAAAVAHPWLVTLAIVLATFVHEDIATVATGILVAQGAIDGALALPALYTGIVLGDLGLYGLGRLMAQNRLARRLSARARLDTLKEWLDSRLVFGVFAVRFLPGLRFSAYTTYGFFAMPFGRFAVAVMAAAAIWTTGLFYLSCEFGLLTEKWLGLWRWPAAALAILAPLLIAQQILKGVLRVPGAPPLPCDTADQSAAAAPISTSCNAARTTDTR